MSARKFSLLAQKSLILIAALAVICFLGFGILLGTEFRITSLQTTNGSVRISWDAPGGSNYIVQSAPRLIGGTPNTNFSDLPGSPIYVSPSSLQSSGYTDTNAMLNSTSRFYRVRSYAAPPTLQIQPTNVVMAPGMTNRYKVMLIYPDNNSQDVTALATNTSLSTNIARVVGVSSNGFLLVRGVTNGTASLRSVYQGQTNTASLTVAQMTNLYTVPSLLQISNYVGATNPSVYVIGSFANGQEKNVTPASNLQGAVEGAGAGGVTRVDYNVRADVANSFALITGQSAADGQTVQFEGGGVLTTNHTSVHWCNYVSVTLVPASAQISIGATQQFSVIANRADGTSGNVDQFTVNSFTSSDDNIAQADPNTFTVVGGAPGTATITVDADNLVNCGSLFSFATVIVTGAPPNITSQPADQLLQLGDNATLSVLATGSPSLDYRWQFNKLNIAGATSKSLAVTNASCGRQGEYRVVVTNVYGSVTSSVATLTLLPDNFPLWTNRYNGPGNSNDAAASIAVDGSGNIFVTGSSIGTVSSNDYATIKYSNTGVPLWTNRYNGPGNGDDYAYAMAVDGSGNVFVTGSSYRSGTSADYATIKYSNTGTPFWTNRYHGPGGGHDNPTAIVIDTNGNLFVTGSSTGGSSGYDYATVKYSNAGVPLWTNRYNGPVNSQDYANAIALDSSGNVFVTGYSDGGSSGYDYATIKYSNAGAPLWTNRYNGPGNSTDVAEAIAVSSSGDIMVAGYSIGTGGNYDYATIKYSNAGALLWANYYNGPANGNDYANAIAVDSSQNIFVTGSASGSSSGYDYATVKYSSAGVPLWTNYYNGPGNRDDYAYALALDRSGNVFVRGTSSGSSGYDYAIIKYSNAGAPLWTNYYNGPGNGDDYANALALDNSGNVLVAGSSSGSSGYDYATIKYYSSCRPANDDFGCRIPLSGSQIVTNANNACASKEAGEPNHTGKIGGKSVWWTWTAPANGSVTISTCGSDFNTLLAVYTGNAINALASVASNDDALCSGLLSMQSLVTFTAAAGTVYEIAVDGYSGASGNITLTIQQ